MSKLVSYSKCQNVTNSVSFASFVVIVTSMSAERKKRLSKAKIAVAVQDELSQVPAKRETEQVFFLTRILYKAVLGLHFKRKEQKKTGQLPIF